MIFHSFVPPLRSPHARRLDPLTVLRVALTLAVISLALTPALAIDTPRLRAEVSAHADVLTLADLTEGLSGAVADTPLFRAPPLGETGTIQARRVVEAANRLGLTIDPAGRPQVTVVRAARRIGAAEIESALKRSLELQHGLEARATSISFDTPPAGFVLAPEATTAITVEELAFDRRNHRISTKVLANDVAGERRPALRVSGTVVESLEVAVLSRALSRGDTLQASDFVLERRVKQSLPSDAQSAEVALAGQVARRPLSAGAIIRAGDFGKPEIVARGEIVTVIYEIPGLILTLRARANEAGAQGDTIAVLNTQSKKTLQATVIGPGKVAVAATAPTPGRLAANVDPIAKP